MLVLLFFICTFAAYVLGVKASAFALGRMTLSWGSSATYAGVSMLVSGVIAVTPIATLVPIGPTSLGTLLILPITVAAGGWVLRRQMTQGDGSSVNWGKCVAVAAAPFLLVAVLGILAAILLPLLRR